MHPDSSPFYEWLEHDAVRELVHGALELTPSERLVLIKGLIPCLVAETGVDEMMDFLGEVVTKVLRFEEARNHPGDGRRIRNVPGEALRRPAPAGRVHLDESRDPDRSGGRDAESEREGRLRYAVDDPASSGPAGDGPSRSRDGELPDEYLH